MNKTGSIASLLALATMSIPANAGVREAAFASSGDQARLRTSMFVGGSYRLGLDGRAEDRTGRTAIKFAGAAQYAGSSRLQLSDGIEIAQRRDGQTALSIAGMDSRQIGRRMNLGDGATAGLVIGGLVLVGLAVAVASTKVPANAYWEDE